MLTTIKGIYEDGHITLIEEPPVKTKAEVIVTFLSEAENKATVKKRREPGSLRGLVDIPDDFNEPLEDLKDYM